MVEPHKWARRDPHTVSVLRRTMDGYTLEIVTHGRNDQGPRRIPAAVGDRLAGVPACATCHFARPDALGDPVCMNHQSQWFSHVCGYGFAACGRYHPKDGGYGYREVRA